MEERLRSHYESLSRAIDFTKTADTKAAPVLLVQAALLGTLATRSDNLVTTLQRAGWSAESVILGALLIVYLALVAASIITAANVYLPRSPKAGGSLIYFEDISAMTFESFREKSSNLSPEIIELQLLDQIYRVSKIASAKMKRVRWAYYLGVPSLILWVGLLAWSSL